MNNPPMPQRTPKESARELAQQAFQADISNYGALKRASDQLWRYMASLVDFDVHTLDQRLNADVMTQFGKAVSPQTAVMCGQEFMRNICFQKGTYAAIKDKLNQQQECHILYAGTGPLATIILPALLLLEYEVSRIHVTFLDISDISLGYLKSLIRALELDAFVCNYLMADACQWRGDSEEESHGKFDIIISETMKAMLVQEPQVFLMANIVHLLKDSGHFIPHSIRLSAELFNHHSEFYRYMEDKPADYQAIDKQPLGQLFELNVTSAKDIAKYGFEKVMQGDIQLSNKARSNLAAYDQLRYLTDIEVYPGYHLGLNACSLNIPVNIELAGVNLENAIRYQYQVKEQYPQFVFDYS